MALFNGTKPPDDFIPWPDRGPNRPPKIKGKRVAKGQSRPAEIWRPEYANLIMYMTGAGMSPKAIATAMGVRFSVFEKWAETNYAVQDALAKGNYGLKIVAIQGLALRAAGFEVDTEKVFYNTQTGKVIRVKTKDYIPPDPKAALAILNRRDPGEPQPFMPPKTVEHSGPGGTPLLANTQTFNTLMLLGSSPDDQQKAAQAYQQLIKGATKTEPGK